MAFGHAHVTNSLALGMPKRMGMSRSLGRSRAKNMAKWACPEINYFADGHAQKSGHAPNQSLKQVGMPKCLGMPIAKIWKVWACPSWTCNFVYLLSSRLPVMISYMPSHICLIHVFITDHNQQQMLLDFGCVSDTTQISISSTGL